MPSSRRVLRRRVRSMRPSRQAGVRKRLSPSAQAPCDGTRSSDQRRGQARRPPVVEHRLRRRRTAANVKRPAFATGSERVRSPGADQYRTSDRSGACASKIFRRAASLPVAERPNRGVRTSPDRRRRRSAGSGRRCSRRARCTGTRRRAEFVDRAEAPAGVARRGLRAASRRTTCLRLRARTRIVARRRSVSNGAGQQVVDRHVVPRDLAREPGDEPGEAGARAVGQAEDVDRRLDRAPR